MVEQTKLNNSQSESGPYFGTSQKNTQNHEKNRKFLMFVTETNLKLLQLHRKHVSRLQRVRRPLQRRCITVATEKTSFGKSVEYCNLVTFSYILMIFHMLELNTSRRSHSLRVF